MHRFMFITKVHYLYYYWHCTVNKYSSKFVAAILIGIALLTISFEVYHSDFNRHCTVNSILRNLSLGYTLFSNILRRLTFFICLFVQKDQSSYHMTSYLNMYSLFIFRNNYFTLSKQSLRSSSKRNTFTFLYLIDFCYYHIKYI